MKKLLSLIFLFSFQGALASKAEYFHSFPDKQPLCYGTEEAPVTIVQYTSPSCHFCAQFMGKILPSLQQEFIDTGKVSLIIMDFPLNDIDMKISQIIRGSPSPCKYQKIIYETQSLWMAAKDPLAKLKEILIKKGLSPQQIAKSLQNEQVADDVVKSRFIAQKKYDIQGVPIFIIGAKEIDGLLDWQDFRKVINQALEHVKQGLPLKTFGKKNVLKIERKITPR